MKKAFTYTIITGGRECINNCFICISKMTGYDGIGYEEPEVNWKAFEKATLIAQEYKAENVLFTGKGELTLYPDQISKYLRVLKGQGADRGFNRYELQTSGTPLSWGGPYDDWLDEWKSLGLDVVAVSIYHYDNQKNKEIFRPKNGKHYELGKLIEKIQSKGLKTRLSCVMLDGYIDSVEEVGKLIEYAKKNDVFQLTLRTADIPKNKQDTEVSRKVERYIRENRLSDEKLEDISIFLKDNGRFRGTLHHDAVVYEVDQQNVCLTTGLSNDKGKEKKRHLIFFPPDILTTSWDDVEGGRIL